MRYVLLPYIPTAAEIEGWCWKQGLEHQCSHHTRILFFTRLHVSLLPMCLYVLFRLNSLHWEATVKEQKLMMTASASASQFLPLKAVFRVVLGLHFGNADWYSLRNSDRRQLSILHQDKVGERQKWSITDGHKVSMVTSFSENPNFGKCLSFSTTPTKLSLSGRQRKHIGYIYTSKSNECGTVFCHWVQLAWSSIHAPKFSSFKTC